ncbi:MAG: adenylosuccinate lyase [Verrucomicrobiales bacterium]|nr:adenylosuccinate lyase [Verrucomicrobiales bacterium]
MIPNILAERYATPAMKDIWSPTGKVRLERELWVAVMKSQRDLGLDIPKEAIDAYEKVIDEVNLEAIDARERVTRHDVKARIEEFCDLAGHEHIHKGMTSRDLTENVEQLQVYRALEVVRFKTAAAIAKMAKHADESRNLVITARTHNVAAQITTMGKRFSMFGEEMLVGLESLENLLATYPVRGLKGAVGTQLDQLSLFDGDSAKALDLEDRVTKHLGIDRKFTNVGQVYPRSLDFKTVSVLNEIASAPSSFSKTLRIMAGLELASEGFAKGQVGSSAMPHKMNSRSCERVNGFKVILSGYLSMASQLAGDQWNEGDVSCSVVRRVMLPDAFFALDGLLETFITILDQMETYPAVIEKENQHYLPFLLSTTIMMAAVKQGIGRETAHEIIKENAVAAAKAYRTGESSGNDMIERLAADGRLGMSESDLQTALQEGSKNIGAVSAQIDVFLKASTNAVSAVSGAGDYAPGSIL